MQSTLGDATCENRFARLNRANACDAVVIGAGAAGGIAAERLTHAGLNVLLLDAGFRRSFLRAPLRRLTAELVSRIANPDFLPFLPAKVLGSGRAALRKLGRFRQPIQTTCYAWDRRPDAFVDDRECPYTTPDSHPFLWIRARGLQGRVGIPGHGRQYLRFAHDDFRPSDGESLPWPFTTKEIDPWYVDVEKRLGMFGTREGLSWFPDSEIAHTLTPTEAEAALMTQLKARWPGAHPLLGRYAPPADTLQGAARTGRLTLRQGAIVRAIEVERGLATGVRWFDQCRQSEQRISVPLVFLCASALESARILMLSQDIATGHFIGSGSNALGRYLMDHMIQRVEGVGAPLPGRPRAEAGRCIYLPRFDSRHAEKPTPGRGFGIQVYQTRIARDRSFFTAAGFAEMLPRAENRVILNRRKVDRWGIPVLHIDCRYGDKERERAAEQTAALRALAEVAGVSITQIDERPLPPGSAMHECGTARMGLDPATSVLDPNNQCWDAQGLYVTDSSAFPSQGSKNPTLTVMALTTRACAHALQSGQVKSSSESNSGVHPALERELAWAGQARIS